MAVRHVQYALGRDAARRHKRVEVQKGGCVVVGEDPDLKRAVGLLDAARAPVKARERHALDALTLTDAATRLAACHLELCQNAKAATVLEQTAKDLKVRSAPRARGRPHRERAGGDQAGEPAEAVSQLGSR